MEVSSCLCCLCGIVHRVNVRVYYSIEITLSHFWTNNVSLLLIVTITNPCLSLHSIILFPIIIITYHRVNISHILYIHKQKERVSVEVQY